MSRCAMKIMDNCIPLIVILGGTGTGKSKLAIEIAKKLGSEIISADSMQVYKGLDILTNKVTDDEMGQVPHHLIDFVSPLENFTVVDFRDRSLSIIDRLFHTGKPPIIVGGTNYYIESILWRVLVKDPCAFSNNNHEDVSVINKEFNVQSMSKGIKRKVDEVNILPTDKSLKILNSYNELSSLVNYCNKLLKSLEDIFFNESSHKVVELFNKLIEEESVDDIKTSVKLFEDNLMESKISMKYAVISLKCCLWLKKYVSVILSNLNKDCNVITDNVVSNPLIEELFAKTKTKNPEFILVVTHALVQNMKSIVKTHIPEFMTIFGDEVDIYFNLNILESPELHELLKNVDPERAVNLHPNDKRKILRSLQVWFSTGCKHSDILKEQQMEGSALGGPLRFKNTIIFWLTADPDVLNKRLDDRVDQMIDRGLVKELLDFYSEYHPKEDDFTKGIFQSIGFKEFREFLFLTDEEKHGEIGKKKLEDGIEILKLVTRRYVRYQNKWIRNRFLKYPDREVPPIYNLDTTDVDHWDELVLNPALDLITCLTEGRSSELKPLLKETEKTKEEIISMKSGEYYCQDCNRTFIGLLQWNTHKNSNRHKKVVGKNKKNSIVTPFPQCKDFEEVEKIEILENR